MRNSIVLLTTIALTFFMTSCSDDTDLTTSSDVESQSENFVEVDPETGEVVEAFNIEQAEEDLSTDVIDLAEIIKQDESEATKDQGKSIARRIYDQTFFVGHGGYKTIDHSFYSMGSCYNRYRVTVIPKYGDPDLYIYGYDKHSYRPWRKVKRARHLGYGKEEVWYNKCNFKSYEDKGVIVIFADGNRNTEFRIIVDRIS